MVKYSCNNFHALKVTFANETARLCEALGVNPFDVMSLVCEDKQLNISTAYLRPGFAFGGSCLPKDLRATSYLAKQRDVELPMLSNVLASNQCHLDHAIAKILAQRKRRIGLIGLAFKGGTDDLRESPMVQLAEQLIGKGLNLSIYDPDVHLSSMLGANRRFIEEHIPHLDCLLHGNIEVVVDRAEVIVVALNDPQVIARLKHCVRDDQTVIDIANIGSVRGLRGNYIGLSWRAEDLPGGAAAETSGVSPRRESVRPPLPMTTAAPINAIVR